ncbi:uncharacterized protein EI90DRAFT_2907111 [Cantharellus anzutake]|uniref:uncharacterized protein n=1 Tax=Cantharellus anzutake TaxID=1750568 RepID=UPI001904549C|nr:uncharacterized protein EI90DRAFT_2907111 [Cantharellus anzutake]KAF8339642.1 hypothetical protein EI90DRAFT_2907111 [Cantharellus anzutake]
MATLHNILAIFLVYIFVSQGQDIPQGGTCNPSANRVDPATHRWVSDCNSKTFCDGELCQLKGCRTHELDSRYDQGDVLIPPLCPQGQFCPDAESHCQPVRGAGNHCELNRDDQCISPPNWQQSQSSMNNGGAICLNFQCMFANVSLGQPCVMDTTLYLALSSTGRQLSNTIYRDNCMAPGLYCDLKSSTCAFAKLVGASCARDIECRSYNCGLRGLCEVPPGSPVELSPLTYSVILTLLFLGIVSVIVSLYFIHSRQRIKRQKEFKKYFREQTSFRDSIISLHSAARFRRTRPSSQPSPPEHVPLVSVAENRQRLGAPPAIRVQPSSNSGSSYTPTLH